MQKERYKVKVVKYLSYKEKDDERLEVYTNNETDSYNIIKIRAEDFAFLPLNNTSIHQFLSLHKNRNTLQ